MILSGSPHLLYDPLLVVSYDMKSWWILQQNSSLCVASYSSVSSDLILSSSTLPPITGRGPASVKCDAPSLVRFLRSYIPSSTWVRNGNMPETLLSIMWQRRLRKRPCFSPFIHVLIPGAGELGGGAFLALSCAHSPSQESVHGNQVTIPALVSP